MLMLLFSFIFLRKFVYSYFLSPPFLIEDQQLLLIAKFKIALYHTITKSSIDDTWVDKAGLLLYFSDRINEILELFKAGHTLDSLGPDLQQSYLMFNLGYEHNKQFVENYIIENSLKNGADALNHINSVINRYAEEHWDHTLIELVNIESGGSFLDKMGAMLNELFLEIKDQLFAIDYFTLIKTFINNILLKIQEVINFEFLIEGSIFIGIVLLIYKIIKKIKF